MYLSKVIVHGFKAASDHPLAIDTQNKPTQIEQIATERIIMRRTSKERPLTD